MPGFSAVDKQPDHIALEHRTLERWKAERSFERLRDANCGAEAPADDVSEICWFPLDGVPMAEIAFPNGRQAIEQLQSSQKS